MRRHFGNRGEAPLVVAGVPNRATTEGRLRLKVRRPGVAAVEFALCAPVIVLALLGVWEVGRIAQVSNIMSNAAREAARDASLGQDNLQTVASNLLTYLQSAQPTAFGQGHTTTLQSPTISLPANTTGYTYWDSTANQELFTITFTDITQPSITDPTAMQKLDHYQIGIQVPYASIGWNSLAKITGVTRITVTVDWACLRDAPFQVSPVLPAQ
jgi:Flp pilus assembly protein TadG